MAKATKPKAQPLPVAKPLGVPKDDEHYGVGANLPAAADEPTPGVINPQANPESNQVDSPVPSSETPTGPLPPNATTVAPPEADGNMNDGGKKTTKSKIVTAQQAVDEANGDREKAMKAHPHLFAETAKN